MPPQGHSVAGTFRRRKRSSRAAVAGDHAAFHAEDDHADPVRLPALAERLEGAPAAAPPRAAASHRARGHLRGRGPARVRSEELTSKLQSLMSSSSGGLCLKKKYIQLRNTISPQKRILS